MIDLLNGMTDDEARQALLRCCASRRWAEGMLARRPFESLAGLEATADWLWWKLERADWLEAFAGHPRIGGDIDQLRRKFQSTSGWSEAEQSGVADASEATLQALAQGNRDYEARFGYIFIVCASGKSASEMLALLQGRLGHGAPEELLIAAEQQRQITRLRLRKLEA